MEDPLISFTEFKISQEPGKAVSAFACCDNYFCYGTFTGELYVFDLEGKLLPNFPKSIYSQARFTSLSFNRTNDLILGTSMFGQIAIIDLTSLDKACLIYGYEDYVNASAIDPELRPGQSFSCFFANGKGIVFRMKPKMIGMRGNKYDLVQVSNPVNNNNKEEVDQIVWRGETVVWETNRTIYIYNSRSDQFIKQINKKLITNTEAKFNQFLRPSFLFNGINLFGVGYGPFLQKVDSGEETLHLYAGQNKFGEKSEEKPNEKNSIALMAQNTNDFADIVIMDNSDSSNSYDNNKMNSLMVELEPLPGLSKSNYSSGKISATLPITDEHQFNSSQMMALSASKDSFFFAIPHVIFKITRRNISELIKYYIEKSQTEIASDLLLKHRSEITENPTPFIIKIAEQYIANNQVDKAIEIFKELETSEQWKQVIDSFQQTDKFDELVKAIPIPTVKFDSTTTTDILLSLCKHHRDRFCEVISLLNPSTDYDVKLVLSEIQANLSNDPNDEYLSPLIKLQHATNNHEAALDRSVKVQYLGTFNDIEQYQQWDYVMKRFLELLQAFPKEFPQWLLVNKDRISTQKVLAKIQSEIDHRPDPQTLKDIDDFKINYMMNLWETKDPTIEQYATEFALLLIRSKHPDTLQFLKSTTQYDFNLAREEARKYEMIPEVAYLCRWTGANEEGLNYLLENAQKTNPAEVVGFAKDCNDKKVWEKLTIYSYNHPDYLQFILENLNDLPLKPVKYIEGIPNEKIGPKFPETALKTIKEFKRRVATASLTQEIVAKDAFGAFQRSFNKYMAGHHTIF